MTKNYKLNKQSKDTLRSKIDEELSKIKFNPEKRIKIPLETLEMLMFDYDKKNNCKKIGFFSDNLCKIDLSELSFKNVNFSTHENKNFSNTNIKINFNEVFRGNKATEKDWICFHTTSFENVDLSNNDISNYVVNDGINHITFEWCNLSNTGLKVYQNKEEIDSDIRFIACNLSNIDLSMIEVPFSKMENEFAHFGSINNLYNTKITFLCKPKTIKEYFNHFEKYQGCYIKYGDRLTYIQTAEEKKQAKNNLKRRYNNFVTNKKANILKIVRNAAVNRYICDKPAPYNDSKDKFKLNKSDIEELRKEINEILFNCSYDPKGRIKLPKQILEMLIFDYHEDEDGIPYKTIAFAKHLDGYKTDLCKLDLSEVSFEDVSFDFEDKFKDTGYRLIFTNTNANIDFRDTYEYQKYGKVIIKYVDFYGTNLSNNNLEELTKNVEACFIRCDLGKTNLQVTKDTNADFMETSLFDVDLSGISIDLDEMRCMPNRNLWFGDCDLQDTGIRIFSTGISKETDFDTVYQNILNYEGCYVNDKKVMSGSEKYDIKQTTFEEYKEYETNTINKTLSLVRNQITEFNDNKGEEDK